MGYSKLNTSNKNLSKKLCLYNLLISKENFIY